MAGSRQRAVGGRQHVAGGKGTGRYGRCEVEGAPGGQAEGVLFWRDDPNEVWKEVPMYAVHPDSYEQQVRKRLEFRCGKAAVTQGMIQTVTETGGFVAEYIVRELCRESNPKKVEEKVRRRKAEARAMGSEVAKGYVLRTIWRRIGRWPSRGTKVLRGSGLARGTILCGIWAP